MIFAGTRSSCRGQTLCFASPNSCVVITNFSEHKLYIFQKINVTIFLLFSDIRHTITFPESWPPRVVRYHNSSCDSQLPLPNAKHHFKLARQKVSRFTNCFPSFRRAFILVGMENLISSDFMPLWKRKKISLPFYAPLFQKAYTNTQAHTHIQLYVWKTHNASLAEGVTKSGFCVRNTLYELKPFFHHISPSHTKTHAHTQAGND